MDERNLQPDPWDNRIIVSRIEQYNILGICVAM